MSNHPNRNWKKRWQVDTASLTATHDNGLSITFDSADDQESALDGRATDIPKNIDYSELPRLMREAGDIMCEVLSQEQKH